MREDPRIAKIDVYIEREFKDLPLIVEKSQLTTSGIPQKRSDYFDELTRIAFTAPTRSDYNIQVNNLAEQHYQQHPKRRLTPPNPKVLAAKRQGSRVRAGDRIDALFQDYANRPPKSRIQSDEQQ